MKTRTRRIAGRRLTRGRDRAVTVQRSAASTDPRSESATVAPEPDDTEGRPAESTRSWRVQRSSRPLIAEPAEQSPAERLADALLRRVGGIDLVEVERANGSMDAVVDRMLASIPGANVLDERVGPFYDTAGLRAWFDMSRQALDAQIRAGDVLCVMSGDNQRLYPSFQFDANGSLLPRLRQVLAVLDPERDALWGDAIWLNAPADELDGMTPAEALRSSRADDAVRLAERAGAFRLG